jgi:hypothetical protein
MPDLTTREAAAAAVAHARALGRTLGPHAVEVALSWLDMAVAAGYSLAGPGDVVVRLPEVGDVEPHAPVYATVVTSGEVHGRLLPPECSDFSDYVHIYAGERGWRSIEHARRSALELLAVAERLAREATPAPESGGGG